MRAFIRKYNCHEQAVTAVLFEYSYNALQKKYVFLYFQNLKSSFVCDNTMDCLKTLEEDRDNLLLEISNLKEEYNSLKFNDKDKTPVLGMLLFKQQDLVKVQLEIVEVLKRKLQSLKQPLL